MVYSCDNVNKLKDRNVKKVFGVVMIIVFLSAPVIAQTYYVATTGSDSSDGSFDHPFATIPKGISVATVPGTTIYVRGGTYAYSTTITISRSGDSTHVYQLLAYPGERAFLDFSSMPISSSNRGIRLSGRYWHIKGFDIWRAGDNGMNLSGSNNIVEFCSFSENHDTGLQLGGGAANNRIINCDSYYNADPSQGNADGFSPKLDVGTGNYFYGCRSWQNSDDGWDGYIRPRPAVVPTTTLENCWSFSNGYLITGLPSTGNGNGFKMGGSDSANLSHNMILKKCLSFRNRVKGFDQNNDRGNMTLLNCTSFSNGTNYGMNGPIGTGSVMTLKNCISAGTGAVNLLSTAVQATNSWMSPFVVTDSDFVSIDTAGVRGPRHPDGSLPDLTFMHLAPGSDLIDAGTDVGLPFNGPAPDLGCFETEGSQSVGDQILNPGPFTLKQNYPNPFNPSTEILFSVEKTGTTTLIVCDVLGRKVATLFDGTAQVGREYRITFDASKLVSGVYFYTLESGSRVDTRKLILLR